ncbi:MAG: hypothetical protein H0V17_00745 [Deltaproteobacteria bacterium]|nr:hypothetical protein [Deltaproteobacteria bacterium]
MQTITSLIRKSPEACWRVLVDPALLTGWVPGLRKARVVATYPTGLPREITFEFSSSLVYSLVYTYDAPRELRWTPGLGARDAVCGFARLEPHESGTRLTYGLELGGARSQKDRAIGDPDAIVAEFVAWMHAY